MSQQQPLVSLQKRTRIRSPIVPEQYHPAWRSKNAPEFLAATLAVKPVKRLARNDEINALARQGRRLSSPFNACETRIPLQQSFASQTHFQIRLDAEHAISMGKK